MKTLCQDRSEFNCIFVHSELDDLGLDPQEFRIYAHLARRANGKTRAWPGITSMSFACRMKRNTVVRAIRGLEAHGLIRVTRKSGGLSEYLLTVPSEWKKPGETRIPLDTGIPKGTGTGPATGIPMDTGAVSDTGVVSQRAPPPVPFGILKGDPREGNPLKKNTVAAPSGAPGSTHPALPATSSLPPDGSVTPSHHAALSQGSSNDGRSHPRPTQTSLQRKGYVIASRLRPLHWDNCKVSYSLHPSRAYAEQALREGHDEGAIIAAYSKALLYCHGVATDEILQGKRQAHEKTTPALTVWLASQRLKQDDRPADQRWDDTNGKRQIRHQEKVQKDARIREEAARLTPEMTAWFARQHDEASPTVPSREVALQPT